jgi:excisionase family DNA binding protein
MNNNARCSAGAKNLPQAADSIVMRLLTVSETAKELNIPRRTVYELVRDGVIPKLALNQRTIRIPIEGAIEALTKLTQQSLIK